MEQATLSQFKCLFWIQDNISKKWSEERERRKEGGKRGREERKGERKDRQTERKVTWGRVLPKSIVFNLDYKLWSF